MTAHMVTQREAEQCVDAIVKAFGYDDDQLIRPQIFDGPHEGLRETAKVIWWEEGPFEWAILATSGGVDEEMTSLMRSLADEFGAATATQGPVVREPIKFPSGVFAEPINGVCLGLYPKEA